MKSLVVRSMACLGLLALASSAFGQRQTTIGTPFNSLGSSFNESIGTGFSFGFRGAPLGPNARGVVGLGANMQLQPNIQFQNIGPAAIPFGQGNTTSGGSIAYAVLGKNFNAAFSLTAGQGASINNESTTASVTSLNGTQGTISATTQRPFVISVVPVVGGFSPGYVMDNSGVWGGNGPTAPTYTSPLAERLERLRSGESAGARTGTTGGASGGGGPSGGAASLAKPLAGRDTVEGKLAAAQASSAGQASDSLRDIQAQQAALAAAQSRELADCLAQAQAAEAAGKIAEAKIYYQQAAHRAAGSQLLEIREKLRELGRK
ncbi:MAG TPA: hypothetical protein VFE24_09570 [Pirellulales bacterium]|nr:hypothetical protein [Pirellulales bacterium]